MPVPRSPTNSLTVSVGVQTHPGLERSDNQDRVTRAATPYGDLFVLADGVGGYQGGEEAAQVVVDGFSGYLNAHPDLDLHEALQAATRAVSDELAHRLAASGARQGMGSTVVLCVVRGTRAVYAHAGDSRLYLVRGGELKQLTRDHSMVERMIAHGILTPEQAHDHPNASALTQALGLSPEITLDIAEVELQTGDALLLCSDGLWGYAAHPRMEAIATSEDLSAAGIAEALLNLALEGGGGDNISIQFLQFTTSPLVLPTTSNRRFRNLAITGFVIASLAGGAALGAFVWNRQHPWRNSVMLPLPHVEGGKLFWGAKAETRTLVTIVHTRENTAAEWAPRLNDLRYLSPVRRAGNDACLALRRPYAILLYLRAKRDTAISVQQDLRPSSVFLLEMTQERAGLCGGTELIALPPNPSATGIQAR